MLNRCEFIGNLGRDPEIRSTQGGTKIANLSLAATETWRDKQSGEKKERTEWVRVAIFGPLADVAEKYLHKGSKVYIAGKMATRKWQDQSGQDRYTTEIVLQGFDAKLVMLDGKQEGGSSSSQSRSSDGGGYGDSGAVYSGGDLDDEVPF